MLRPPRTTRLARGDRPGSARWYAARASRPVPGVARERDQWTPETGDLYVRARAIAALEPRPIARVQRRGPGRPAGTSRCRRSRLPGAEQPRRAGAFRRAATRRGPWTRARRWPARRGPDPRRRGPDTGRVPAGPGAATRRPQPQPAPQTAPPARPRRLRSSEPPPQRLPALLHDGHPRCDPIQAPHLLKGLLRQPNSLALPVARRRPPRRGLRQRRLPHAPVQPVRVLRGRADEGVSGPRLSYADALAALEARGRFGIRLGLGRVRALLRELDDPQPAVLGALVAGRTARGASSRSPDPRSGPPATAWARHPSRTS